MTEHTPIEFFAERQAAALDQALRHQHEVELVARLETNARRAWYIESEGGVRENRGDAVAERLRRDVWRFMRANGLDVEPEQEALFA